MKQMHLLLVAVVLLGGCVSPGVVPSREDIAKIAEVRVIPIEAPPLAVPPASGVLIQGIGVSPVARGVSVVGTLLLLLQMPEISERTGEVSQSLQAALDGVGVWVPTVELANETQAQLAARGLQVAVTSEVKRLSGVQDRRYTMLMENWLAPIRAWYNSADPVPDYRGLRSSQSVYVLEVGVINYEITSGRLLLQVAMKLIDASDGRVIGRARAANPWNMPNLAPLDQAFAKDAIRFKQAFTGAAQHLVRECLTSLGLLP